MSFTPRVCLPCRQHSKYGGIFLLYEIVEGTVADSVVHGVSNGQGPEATNHFVRAPDAEIIQMAGNVPTTALINGDIDYFTVIINGVRGAILGLPLRVVACYVPRAYTVVSANHNKLCYR
jgi:hypothetical protein